MSGQLYCGLTNFRLLRNSYFHPCTIRVTFSELKYKSFGALLKQSITKPVVVFDLLPYMPVSFFQRSGVTTINPSQASCSVSARLKCLASVLIWPFTWAQAISIGFSVQWTNGSLKPPQTLNKENGFVYINIRSCCMCNWPASATMSSTAYRGVGFSPLITLKISYFLSFGGNFIPFYQSHSCVFFFIQLFTGTGSLCRLWYEASSITIRLLGQTFGISL